MKKLYVGNLSFKATEDDMRNLFSQFGEVVSAKIVMDRDTGRSKGFGFVEMADDGAAETAIGQLDDYEGVAAEADEVQLYRRELTEAYVNGETIPAWVYWFCCDVSGKPLIPSGDMMEYMNKKK